MRLTSLNLRAYPNRGRENVTPLARLLAKENPDIALIQECLGQSWFDMVVDATGMDGTFSHNAEPTSDILPPDGCGILVRTPLQLKRAWRVPPSDFEADSIDKWVGVPASDGTKQLTDRLLHRFSARSMFAEIGVDGQTFTAASLHATPGEGEVGGEKVGMRKTYFHAGVARAVSDLGGPFIFAIDANEPRRETQEVIEFHWPEGTAEAARAETLLGLKPRHRGSDLLRLALKEGRAEAVDPEFLEMTYETERGRPGSGRRFDSIWATGDFIVDKLRTEYRSVLAAGGDHAMLIADLDLRSNEA